MMYDSIPAPKNQYTFCNKVARVISHQSGRQYVIKTCEDEYCVTCHQKKRQNKIRQYSILYQLEPNCCFSCCTTLLGGHDSIKLIPQFERDWQRQARREKLLFTFLAGYEVTDGLVHLHYGMFTTHEQAMYQLDRIIDWYASVYFPDMRCKDQTKVTKFTEVYEMMTYVTKCYWSDLGKFLMPQSMKKVNCRWRRGYRQFFSNLLSEARSKPA